NCNRVWFDRRLDRCGGNRCLSVGRDQSKFHVQQRRHSAITDPFFIFLNIERGLVFLAIGFSRSDFPILWADRPAVGAGSMFSVGWTGGTTGCRAMLGQSSAARRDRAAEASGAAGQTAVLRFGL